MRPFLLLVPSRILAGFRGFISAVQAHRDVRICGRCVETAIGFDGVFFVRFDEMVGS